ncbi:CBO2463/CBO2479 domain-containing protein [Clostridiisalibacter paucivorans]|uniref:CBO2463/CBO2479 domain-containing protein n=1 Tax=Clostridiisalibacter paucivorans TaxID=408753 RepID=UPI000478C782|nr:CBO2463/CBO2479 domain-containing protein [Clostridiisalibacter paucivorans]
MDKLKYVSTERYYEGIIVEINDCAIAIDFKGRMGKVYVPRRMVISDYDLKIGQEVGFMMTYPEVLGPDIDENYANNAKRQLKIKKNLKL